MATEETRTTTGLTLYLIDWKIEVRNFRVRISRITMDDVNAFRADRERQER